jgi:hypothetical protein
VIKALESLGERMLALVLPTVKAAAGCPPDPWCKTCTNPCYVKRCYLTPRCTVRCGSCGYSCSASASVGMFC